MAGSGNELQVRRMFDSLKTISSGVIFPPTSLSMNLEREVNLHPGISSFNVPQKTVQLFATAAIEMWHRSMHSYLTSLALTKASHIWSSVAGYYSSHYAVRAIAHVLGTFQLFDARKIVELDLTGIGNVCNVRQKSSKEGREHDVYWRFVKSQPPFHSAPLFTNNNVHNGSLSDAKHRERANYADHINRIPFFLPLDVAFLKERADHISRIPIYDPPIPDFSKYAEIENVQIVAYHRLVFLRTYLDDILGTSINYWNVHRNPTWARSIINYEIVESDIEDYINI